MSARKAGFWANLVRILIIGYSCLGRSFAYVGLAPAYLFIGEMSLFGFLSTNFRGVDFFFLHSKRNNYTQLLRISLTCFLLYGLVTVGIGYYHSYRFVTILQNFVFNCYALYLVIGVAVGAAAISSTYLQDLVKKLAWIHGIYGVLYVTVLISLNSYTIPLTPNVAYFGQPVGSGLSILAILAYEKKFDKQILPVLLNLITLFGVQVRAEWLGCIVAFTVWSFLAKKMQQYFVVMGMAIFMLAIGLFFDIRVEGGRGGEISAQAIIGRALSSFDEELAVKFWPEAKSTAGTAEWRQIWWTNIWKTINGGDPGLFFFGTGYGFTITDLGPESGTFDARTPHNIFYAVLCYGGWLGALFFGFFHFALVWAMWRIYKLTKDPFGIAFYLFSMCTALLGNCLETPFGAIPFYLVIGVIISPLFARYQNMMLVPAQPIGYAPLDPGYPPQMPYPNYGPRGA